MRAKILSAVVIAGSVTPLLFAPAAFAWHPVGKITKQVQNVTTKGELKDANDAATAVDVKTGDIVKYVITVSNEGNVDASGNNDMAFTVLTDTLPEGVELVASPDQHAISVNLGTIKPKAKVTKEYEVKVTSATNKLVIENKACFTGNSTVNDNAQKGCDTANVKTNIPQTSSTTTTTPSPTPTPTPAPQVQAAAVVMPNTGVDSKVIGIGLTATILGYVVAMRRQTKRLA